MTERGLPIVGGAPACPFVAFEDDRDERGTSPDHRHRCYAEAQPAPRALAHQEAYCLASAFPVCPTFQDWARREAAKARPQPSRRPSDEPDEDLPPLVADRPPRRSGPHTWAAPPPWLRGTGGQGPEAGQGSDAERAAAAAEAAARSREDPGREPASAAAMGAAAGGLAGSFADRLTSHDDVPPGARPASSGRGAWDEDDDAAAAGAASGAALGAGAVGASAGRGLDPAIDDSRTGPRRREHERFDSGQDDPADDRQARGPAWERPRRLEAYPTLRSRRFSAAFLPPLLIGIVAVLIVAAALFFLPSLLGVGGPASSGSPSQSASGSQPPSVSLAPSAVPAATATVYLVQPGDTMSKIAKKFHVNLVDLIAANAGNIKNPDVLKIGDPVIIPSATPSGPAASAP